MLFLIFCCVPASAQVCKPWLPVCHGTRVYLQTHCFVSAEQGVHLGTQQLPVITAEAQMMLTSLLTSTLVQPVLIRCASELLLPQRYPPPSKETLELFLCSQIHRSYQEKC